jgi:DNA repair exonuclease SbcCD ATPase subunit
LFFDLLLPCLFLFLPRQNLLCSKEAAALEIQRREANPAADKVAADLRAELTLLAGKHDEASSALHEAKRSNALLDGELRHARAGWSKAKSDKLDLERRLRAASLSLAELSARHHQGPGDAGGGDAHDRSVADFYKKKTADLQDQVTRWSVTAAEKDRQIRELRRELERSLPPMPTAPSSMSSSSSYLSKAPKKPRAM